MAGSGSPSADAAAAAANGTERSNPTKRIRWATRKLTGKDASRKRSSLLGRGHGEKRRSKRSSATTESDGKLDQDDSGAAAVASATAEEEGEDEDGAADSGSRRIFFNIPLPSDARDEDGRPLNQYARNKIRTAKYTPISFLPKNLWFQFHNIANLYFLFIIILSFFSIFGAANPGLDSVPLIVILTVTAIKDAIEDWRRTVLDNELNNAPVHRLVGFNNVNTAEDKVSLWRKFKKANSRAIRWVWSKWTNRKTTIPKEDKGKTDAERALEQSRPSIDVLRASSRSMVRQSVHSTRGHSAAEGEGGIQMTPVPSPLPGQKSPIDLELEKAQDAGISIEESSKQAASASGAPLKSVNGSVINPRRQPDDKARFKKDFWKHVQVGDYLRLYDGEEIPADIVVLSTSDPEGTCYVETKNLDGETNLKARSALHCSRMVRHARDCEQAEFMIQTEPPHANLYSFNGVIQWQQHEGVGADGAAQAEMTEPISIGNMLLRGSSLRNTDWILGVVVYTGRETKIMLNSGITPSKRAKISKDLNWNVIYNFIILFVMCMIAAIVQGYTWGQPNTTIKLFEFGAYGSTPGLSGFITFWAAIILFQNLVPISLYISLEIIRTLQAFFIYSDVDMYYEKLDYPCTPKSWNISDDLGQIEYIFSDKTGTLTQNVMEFKKCTVNGVPYGEAYTEALAGLQKRQGINADEEGERARKQIAEDRVLMLEKLRKIHDNPYLVDDRVTFVAPDFVADLDGGSGQEQKDANIHFMLILALCHTVITERTPGDPPKIEFKAQSPDEAALVATARDCGFTVIGRTDDGIIVNVLGTEKTYTVLNILEFNSSRKRMSAIMKMPDGRIMLLCKGADSVIYSRLCKGEQPELRRTTAEHLEMFAREGLRTLCIAEREISEEEYREWNKQHEAAAASITDRDENLESVAEAIERDLHLLGGTAIEDRLQEGVPEAIQLLGKAGIKLWVLTGDKVETAINIGFSCNLLDNDMDLIVFKIEDEQLSTAEAELNKHLETFNITGSDEELKAARKDHTPPDPTHAIVIDGDSLKLVLDATLQQKFLLLCKQCRAVLCCRVSPSQKAAVVQLVKRGLDCLTLSIGDGANDVAMIQEAHVGVGIAGEEGRQAVMSSDFAIGQFRYLTRLVLVHGRWSYRRLAETIANFFYKNLVWTVALFWYQMYTNFDCTYIFDYTYILLFNLAFTSLPVILMGVLDQDVDDKVSLVVPQLYRRGIERKEWTQPKFWLYMLDGIYQSVIVFFMTYLLFSPSTVTTESGRSINDSKRMGVYIASSAVVVVNLYILFNTYRWDWLLLLITSISVLLIWFWTGVYTSFTAGFTFSGSATEVYGALSFWAVLLLTVVICLAPRFTVKSAQKIFFPRDVDIIREQIRQGKFDYLRNTESFIPSPPDKVDSLSSADSTHKKKRPGAGMAEVDEDLRPIRAGSLANSGMTHQRTQTGSDGTDFTIRSSIVGPLPGRSSLERIQSGQARRPSTDPIDRITASDRPRPSFERARMSMDRIRPSFENSQDFTSAANLMRIESGGSGSNFPTWSRKQPPRYRGSER